MKRSFGERIKHREQVKMNQLPGEMAKKLQEADKKFKEVDPVKEERKARNLQKLR